MCPILGIRIPVIRITSFLLDDMKSAGQELTEVFVFMLASRGHEI